MNHPASSRVFLPAGEYMLGERDFFSWSGMGNILNNSEKFKLDIPFGCAPPSRVRPRQIPRFAIPEATPCQISKVAFLHWKHYTTKKDLEFEKFETYRNGSYTFRYKGFLIFVHRSWVFHREDLPGYNTGN